jgi:hypothetical protein
MQDIKSRHHFAYNGLPVTSFFLFCGPCERLWCVELALKDSAESHPSLFGELRARLDARQFININTTPTDRDHLVSTRLPLAFDVLFLPTPPCTLL